MGDHDITPTCLSAEEHGEDGVSDKILHYLGCLEFSEREQYFHELDKEDQTQIESDLRRIKYLRNVLGRDSEDSKLISNLEDSLRIWRKCEIYQGKHGIDAVREWRSAKDRANKERQRDPHDSPSTSPTSSTNHPKYDPDRDLNAYLIRYVKSEGVTDLESDKFNGHFPNHKIAVSVLLDKETQQNPLAKELHPDQSINYFHLPANNMQWVEKAIARYFGEKDMKYDGIYRHPSERTKTSTLLRPEFWKGQQHGGRSASVHARHLRPLCEAVSSDPYQVENAPRNLALFMPYLHWETDRQREKLSQVLDLESATHRGTRKRTEGEKKQERQVDRGGLIIPSIGKPGNEVNWKEDTHRFQSLIHRASTLLWDQSSHIFKDGSKKSSPFKSKDGRILAGTEVGQVLLDAAVLYEAMTNYRDKRLIRQYLHCDPPLHPRRTLDQAYYWTLKTTKLRDRDQVVYRGTTVDRGLWHRLVPKKQPRKLRPGTKTQRNKTSGRPEFEFNCVERNKASKRVLLRESAKAHPTSSNPEVDDKFCPHCRDNIRKVSRVVMVDQLWMWILDEQTIITCFPKRYGVNKRDPSGVHKCIRSRLKGLRKDHIRTVFDLALIILAECSSTFFDRTKTQDRQPQVMDIFSESIGIVNNEQTTNFEHLWEFTGKLGRFAQPGHLPANLSDLVIPLLNINKEGKLQREIKDIIDELDIMIYISTQQRDVIRKFKKEVTHLMDPHGTWKDKLTNASIGGTQRDDTQGDGTQVRDSQDMDTQCSGTEGVDSSGKDYQTRHDDYFWFVHSANELLGDVDNQIGELEGLKKSAVSTSTSLDHLLNLKQQQASVFQTWQSTKQAEETIRQSRAIIIFTVMTIIFLPLGFIASIFGMNNKQISGNDMPMTLRSQFRYMFFISIGIIAFALVIAFSSYIRTLIYLVFRYLITLTVTKLGLYDRVYLGRNWRSRDLVRQIEGRVAKMKADVKAARQKRIKAKSTRPDSKDKASTRGDDNKDRGSGSGANAQQNNSTAVSAPDGSAAPDSNLRSRASRLAASDAGVDTHDHVINIGAANTWPSVPLTPLPTPARIRSHRTPQVHDHGVPNGTRSRSA